MKSQNGLTAGEKLLLALMLLAPPGLFFMVLRQQGDFAVASILMWALPVLAVIIMIAARALRGPEKRA